MVLRLLRRIGLRRACEAVLLAVHYVPVQGAAPRESNPPCESSSQLFLPSVFRVVELHDGVHGRHARRHRDLARARTGVQLTAVLLAAGHDTRAGDNNGPVPWPFTTEEAHLGGHAVLHAVRWCDVSNAGVGYGGMARHPRAEASGHVRVLWPILLQCARLERRARHAGAQGR